MLFFSPETMIFFLFSSFFFELFTNTPVRGDIRRLQYRACLLVASRPSIVLVYLRDGRICPDKLTCCHSETEVAVQTVCLTQSKNTDTGPTICSADPVMPCTWQGRHWSTFFFFLSHWFDSIRKNLHGEGGNRTPGLPLLRLDALTT